MTEYHCLEPQDLEVFLERRRAIPSFALDMSLAENLAAVLRKANEFVPSLAGSLLLDNPLKKNKEREENSLTFIATFGDKARELLRQTIPANKGIAGHVYLTGTSYVTRDLSTDKLHHLMFDQANDYPAESLVAIPVRIEQEVCGVLELVNRSETGYYSERDVHLLEIFAEYISISIQNVLDGRQAQEIAKRDNLTGLYNDRYLHIALSKSIAKCRRENLDLALLFMDLDFFKRVNDSHGHLAGSQVLREVGILIKTAMQFENAIAARYGGDEFVVALPERDLLEAIKVAEDLRHQIVTTTFCDKPGEIQPDPIHLTGLTCSVGVATLHRHLQDTESVERTKSTLLRLADSAMYVAKETGRNRTATAGEPVRRLEARRKTLDSSRNPARDSAQGSALDSARDSALDSD
ncbi:MAG: sensor domain-containing diguanylate cyclase [Acidobacteria bacterium]|nr:sensor domain-containing diguanylate cyclase [Acidobacteriota bacterium]